MPPSPVGIARTLLRQPAGRNTPDRRSQGCARVRLRTPGSGQGSRPQGRAHDAAWGGDWKDFDETSGSNIDLSGVLAAGQLDTSHVRLASQTGNTDLIDMQVDTGSRWKSLLLLECAKAGSGTLDGSIHAITQATLDSLTADLIANGTIHA